MHFKRWAEIIIQLLPHRDIQALNKGKAHRLCLLCNLLDLSVSVHQDPCNLLDWYRAVPLDTIMRNRQKSVQKYIILCILIENSQPQIAPEFQTKQSCCSWRHPEALIPSICIQKVQYTCGLACMFIIASTNCKEKEQTKY